MTDVPQVGMVRRRGVFYPSIAPFDPSCPFPELSRAALSAGMLSVDSNDVYGIVREALASMGLDAERFGSAEWNPFRGLVPSRGLVVIKPNLVLETRHEGDARFSVVTHASIIRPLIDYVRLAGGREVEILIGDVPLQGADFDAVVDGNGLRAMVRILRERGDAKLELRDLRRERALVDGSGFITRVAPLAGDPRGYVAVDIGSASRLEGLPAETFEGFAVSDYRTAATQTAHAPGRHEYLIPGSVLAADLLINVPKLKTHQKAGLTVALKNLVGVNGDKARIPHFRLGTLQAGGDEYPSDQAWLRAAVSRISRLLQRRSRLAYHAARRLWRATRGHVIQAGATEIAGGATTLVGGGAWHGNDTLWRALHDLNHIIAFADSTGQLHETRQRKYLCVVDGIVAGEGDGPLVPLPRREGLVLCGCDPLAIDLVAARYMWLDWRRIPQLADALRHRPAWTRVRAPVDEGGVILSAPSESGAPWADRPFLPPPGWVGKVELDMTGVESDLSCTSSPQSQIQDQQVVLGD